jgi:tetratricopeptide (TPR) repeat protein
MPRPAPPFPVAGSRDPIRIALPAAVFVITALCFSGSIGHGFLKGDDQPLLIDNTAYRGLGWSHLRWMFTTFLTGPYMPVSWISYAIDWSLWGLNPRGFHLTNVLLHAATAVAVYLLSQRLIALAGGGDERAPSTRAGAAFAALFFALHPLRVESVAFVTERRDVLSGLFYVSCVIYYVRYATVAAGSRVRVYLAAFLLYVLSVLAKAIGMTLPIILLLLDVYPLRRLGGSRGWFGRATALVWLEKLPFAVVSLAIAALAVHGQRSIDSFVPVGQYGLGARVAIAAFGTCFYVWKLVLPFGLCRLYELPAQVDPFRPVFLGGFVGVVGVTIVAFVQRRRWPALLTAWLCYLITLAPVSGLAQAGEQIACDRYTYLPLLGFAVLAGGIVARLMAVRSERGRASAQPVWIGSAVVLALLAGLTIRQVRFWADDWTLWTRVVSLNSWLSPSSRALANVSILCYERGDTSGAIEHAAAAVQARPEDIKLWKNYAVMLAAGGRHGEALEAYRRTAEAAPDRAEALADYAGALLSSGRWEQAEPLVRRALEIEPGHAQALYLQSVMHARRGEFAEADRCFDAAEATGRLTREMYVESAAAWFAAGRPDRAIHVLRAAVARHPGDDYLAIMLAWPLATHPRDDVRNGADAARLARAVAMKSGPYQAVAQKTLAAALAETGDFAAARAALAPLASAAGRASGSAEAADLAAMDRELAAGRPIRREP